MQNDNRADLLEFLARPLRSVGRTVRVISKNSQKVSSTVIVYSQFCSELTFEIFWQGLFAQSTALYESLVLDSVAADGEIT